MLFQDRLDAACQLASALAAWRGTDPLVLAVPPGAVPMGRVIADRLDGDLDVVLVRKLRSAFNPRFAIGAVDESGAFELRAQSDLAALSREHLEREKTVQLAHLRALRRRWSHRIAPVDPSGRVVIVVDDGIATGATLAAALRFLRERGARELVCAVPVAAPGGLARVAPLADAHVALAVPERFTAVADYYRDLPQVEDDEVAELLAA